VKAVPAFVLVAATNCNALSQCKSAQMGVDFDLSNEDGIRTAIIRDSQMVAIERACPKKHTSEKN